MDSVETRWMVVSAMSVPEVLQWAEALCRYRRLVADLVVWAVRDVTLVM